METSVLAEVLRVVGDEDDLGSVAAPDMTEDGLPDKSVPIPSLLLRRAPTPEDPLYDHLMADVRPGEEAHAFAREALAEAHGELRSVVARLDSDDLLGQIPTPETTQRSLRLL